MGISRHSLSRREFAKTTLAAGVAAITGTLTGCALSMGRKRQASSRRLAGGSARG